MTKRLDLDGDPSNAGDGMRNALGYCSPTSFERFLKIGFHSLNAILLLVTLVNPNFASSKERENWIDNNYWPNNNLPMPLIDVSESVKGAAQYPLVGRYRSSDKNIEWMLTKCESGIQNDRRFLSLPDWHRLPIDKKIFDAIKIYIEKDLSSNKILGWTIKNFSIESQFLAIIWDYNSLFPSNTNNVDLFILQNSKVIIHESVASTGFAFSKAVTNDLNDLIFCGPGLQPPLSWKWNGYDKWLITKDDKGDIQ
jgi:hypothetical protein